MVNFSVITIDLDTVSERGHDAHKHICTHRYTLSPPLTDFAIHSHTDVHNNTLVYLTYLDVVLFLTHSCLIPVFYIVSLCLR